MPTPPGTHHRMNDITHVQHTIHSFQCTFVAHAHVSASVLWLAGAKQRHLQQVGDEHVAVEAPGEDQILHISNHSTATG